MRPTDFAKAVGLGAAILVIDVLLAFAVVYAWGIFVAPGHTTAYYEDAAVPIARWSARTIGTALMFAAAWLSARRRPDRNAYAYAVTLVFFYAFFDGASVAFAGFFTLGIALTMLIKLIGALAGAYVSRAAKSWRRA
jgi:hypothetical protein